MKKKPIIILTISGLIISILGIILLNNNIIIKAKSELQIIDATYSCNKIKEKFYENDKYIYSFPCTQSTTIYVKFKNGNKMLVTDALESNKVTLEELIDAGLKVDIEKK